MYCQAEETGKVSSEISELFANKKGRVTSPREERREYLYSCRPNDGEASLA
jgi:hypothetical protein